MKVITLNHIIVDSEETEVLFAVNDINNINEVEFIERIKKVIRPYVGDYFPLSTTDKKIESYANEVLNSLKQGKNEKWLDDYAYLDFKEVDIL